MVTTTATVLLSIVGLRLKNAPTPEQDPHRVAGQFPVPAVRPLPGIRRTLFRPAHPIVGTPRSPVKKKETRLGSGAPPGCSARPSTDSRLTPRGVRAAPGPPADPSGRPESAPRPASLSPARSQPEQDVGGVGLRTGAKR